MARIDLLDLHNTILGNFQKQKASVPELNSRIEELSRLLSSLPDLKHESIQNEIDALKERVILFESDMDMNFYLLKVTPLMEEYKSQLNKPVQLSFMGKREDNSKSEEIMDSIQNKMMDIIKTTPGVCTNGLENSVIDEATDPMGQKCDHCQHTDEIIAHNNTVICSNCGTERQDLCMTFSYNDTDRVNITSKYTYARRVHFRECINQFQGKQNSMIKPEVYEGLIRQLELHGLVRPGKLPKRIKYEKVTKFHIGLFLKEIDCARHYEDINLIYRTITDKELNDITHLEEVLMDDFDTLSDLYNEIYIKTKKINRKNFINTSYVLYQLLQRHKYQVLDSDFSFLKTIERKAFHDEICSTLFKHLEWRFNPVF
jgi:hypothetical protein